MFKNLAAGGQTIAHGFRMLRQVIKIAGIVGLVFAVGHFAYAMWQYPHSHYTAFPKYFKAFISLNTHAIEYYDGAMVEVFKYAFDQIKPSAIFGGWVFLIVAIWFQIKGTLGKKKEASKNKIQCKKSAHKKPVSPRVLHRKSLSPKRLGNQAYFSLWRNGIWEN